MFCVKCDKDMAECECADAAERIRSVMESPYIAFGSDYKARLIQHAEELESQKTTQE